MVHARASGLVGTLLVLGAIATACTQAEDAPTAAEHEHGGGESITLWTDSLELFMEHPPLMAGVESEPWAIHLTWMADWQPVREGSLEIRLTGSAGDEHVFEAAAPARAGIFGPQALLPSPGLYELTLRLEARGRSFPIPVGPVEVFADEAALPHEEDAPATGSISFLKEQQWEIPFAVEEASIRQIGPSIDVAGRIDAPPDRIARISAPVSGIVAVEGSANVGQRISAGQALAVFEPTEGASSYSSLRAEVDRLSREAERAERLFAAGAIPERRVIESKHELEVARARLAGVGGGGPESGDDSAYRFRLRSPISGIVVDRNLSPGQRVEAGDPAFTVLDGGTLWLQLHVPAAHAAAASSATGATFTVEGGSRVYATSGLISVGSVLDAATRTLPVVLRVENPTGEIKVGMLADARLFLGEAESGVAVPDIAIREEDGLHVAYVEVGGESFERRVLDRGPGDGQWTLIRRGVAAGEHVVTEGAYQVRLASLGEVEPADHGHPH
jgi:RND family efflux transporter MFP subunit